MDKILCRLNGQPVHHFNAAGDNARANDIGDALTGIFTGGKTNEDCPCSFGFLQDTDRDFGHHGQKAL